MPLKELVAGPNPAREDVQRTAFSYDVLGRYLCNSWFSDFSDSFKRGFSFKPRRHSHAESGH
jgi:hypothetical protein